MQKVQSFTDEATSRNTPTNPTIRKLTTRLALALISLYILTSVHHLYGGAADGIHSRMMVPLIMAFPLVASLGLLYHYRQSGHRATLKLFCLIVVPVFVILLGVVHSGYSHAYKDLLSLLNGSPEWYYRLNPDEHYPPDNLFFELTGLLEMVPAYLIARFTWQLTRTRHQPAAR